MQEQVRVTKQSLGLNKQSINNWLQERHRVLTAYCDLAGVNPNLHQQNALPKNIYVQHFCQLLMDYISAGHFEIFELILEECQRTASKHVQTVNELCPKIYISTDYALHFNDKYSDEISNEQVGEFDRNLSLLGNYLEQRFELEDMLISTIQ